MKRVREIVSATELTELLERFKALSIVVREELPDVLEAGVRVPHRFTEPTKLKKKS